MLQDLTDKYTGGGLQYKTLGLGVTLLTFSTTETLDSELLLGSTHPNYGNIFSGIS